MIVTFDLWAITHFIQVTLLRKNCPYIYRYIHWEYSSRGVCQVSWVFKHPLTISNRWVNNGIWLLSGFGQVWCELAQGRYKSFVFPWESSSAVDLPPNTITKWKLKLLKIFHSLTFFDWIEGKQTPVLHSVFQKGWSDAQSLSPVWGQSAWRCGRLRQRALHHAL